MPYKNIDEAKEANFPIVAEDIELSLIQINRLAELYDAVKDNKEVENPMAVAWTQWKKEYKKENDKWVKVEPEAVFEKEIFRAGTWTDNSGKTKTYTTADIETMVEAFNNKVMPDGVPLKLGHSKNQKLLQADGYPAAGWVKELKKIGDRLVAVFSNVPKKIREFIENKSYRNVSCELIHDFNKDGKIWPKVLTAVSLLGEDMPAVEGLGDFRQLFFQSAGNEILFFSSDEKGNLSEYILNEEEKNDMDELKEKELNDKIVELQKTIASQTEQISAFEKSVKEEKAKLKKSEIETMLSKLKSEGKVSPVLSEKVAVILEAIESEQVVKFSKEGKDEEVSLYSLVKDFLENLPVNPMFVSATTGTQKTDDKFAGFVEKDISEFGTVESQKLLFLAKKKQSENKELDFSAALSSVKKENPELDI